jgi:hypothetical protein
VAAGIKADDVEYEKACGQVTSYYKLSKSGIDKINKYRNDQALKTNKELQKGYDDNISHYETMMEAANAKAEAAKSQLTSYGGTGTKPGSGKPTPHSSSGNSDKKDVEAVKGSL